MAAFLSVASMPLAAGLARPALADVTTYSNDVGRSGWDPNEAGLDPATVQSAGFRHLFSTAVSGQVVGQPLVYQSTVIVATQEDLVYGVDAATGTIKWVTRVGSPQPTSSVPNTFCADIKPFVGITTTPVIDPASGSLYVTARNWDPANPGSASWLLARLSAVDGSLLSRETLGGAATNDASVVFDPVRANQRPGLLLMNGWIYAGFGSFCDLDPYRGWVIGVNISTGQQKPWTDEASPEYSPRAGVWQTGGLASDGPGRILLVTGNGTIPPAGPGNAPPGTLGSAAVRLAVAADGSMTAVDFFAPSNAEFLSEQDLDLGTGGMAVMPATFPLSPGLVSAHPHLAAFGGKEGRFYLVDRDNLGGEAQGPGGADAVVAEAAPFPSQAVFTRPAFWPGDGGYVYFDTAGTGNVHAFQVQADGSLAVVGQGAPTGPPGTRSPFGFGSGAPVVTSNGTGAGSAVVWVMARPGISEDGAGSSLLAYRAVPDGSGQMALLRAFPIGVAAKFSAPATDQGRVYVATQDGHVLGFGVGSPAVPAGRGVILDGWGGLHAYASSAGGPAIDTSGGPQWQYWDIARGVAMTPAGRGGYVLDGWGGVHRFGGNPGPDYPYGGSAYWPGWDIARGISTVVGGSGGYVLDGWGGVHAFGGTPAIADNSHAYWPGWDIARAIAVRPDGDSGYVLDGWGGVHAFGGAPPVDDHSHAYWPGWDIARGLVLDATGDGGWILDGWGGIHAFGAASLPDWPSGGSAYWPGWDIARGITLMPGSDSSGYVLDGWGGLHAFGAAPPIADSGRDGYWTGWDIARAAGGP